MQRMKQKLAILLSGTGSNAREICRYFEHHPSIEVSLLLSNKEDSGATAIGDEFKIPYFVFTRDDFYHTDQVIFKLAHFQISTLILAGFLWLIPGRLVKKYADQIINIHPALLPEYGGKGMHGSHVHKAVFENKDKISGITIHLCNEKYDEGKVLFQKTVELDDTDTPDTIAKKVLQLEHAFYPKVIEEYLSNEK